MRKVVLTLLILFCFILQCTVCNAVALAGVIPNILIILTASFGFMRGESEGLVIGFFSGLLYDIFFGSFLGFFALVLMLIGYVNGMFSRIFYKEDIKLPIVLILVSDFTYGIVNYIFLFLFNGKFHFAFYFYHIILPEMLYTILVTVIFYPLFLLINIGLEKHEKGR